MRIGVVTLSTPNEKIGVGVYLGNLLRNLEIIDKKNCYILFCSQKDKVDFGFNNFSKVNLNVSAQPSIKLVLWQPILLLKCLLHKTDVIHWTNTMPVLFRVCPTVITIHDLQEFYTDKYGKLRTIYRKTINRIAAHLADRIITPSEHSKRDIVKLLNVHPSKVAVIYEGVEGAFRPLEKQSAMSQVSEKYLLDAPYIISVGELHPAKNFVRLIEAFARLKAQGCFEHKLVIVGKKGWRYADIFAQVKNLKLEKEVIFTGYVSSEDLILLYNAADLCVYPTLYEGFGLPALEAMACGVPLIASNVSSLPEVGGDAVVFFDPYSVDDIYKAAYRVLADERLSHQMRVKGLERAKQFSWEKMARQTLEVYEDAKISTR